jgi:Protein of unknown function (DUF2742)
MTDATERTSAHLVGDHPPPEYGGSRGVPTHPAPLKEFDSHTELSDQFSELNSVGARTVSWWSVHVWVQTYLDAAGHYPQAGTLAWCELADGDRRKWAAVLDFAQHHALRVETAQEAQAAAAKDIASAVDWSAIAGEIRSRSGWCASRPWMKRGAA